MVLWNHCRREFAVPVSEDRGNERDLLPFSLLPSPTPDRRQGQRRTGRGHTTSNICQPQTDHTAATTLGSRWYPVILVELRWHLFLHVVIPRSLFSPSMVIYQPLQALQSYKAGEEVGKRVTWALNNPHPTRSCTSASQLFPVDTDRKI